MSYLDKIDKAALPKHVAIIMDGNGRWAIQRRMPRLQGHRNAVKAVRRSFSRVRFAGVDFICLLNRKLAAPEERSFGTDGSFF